MQKRILSLVLVLCMVLALVPALMLPLMAEETDDTFVTKFSENRPTITAIEDIDETNKLPYSFEYHGSWTVGKKTAANDYLRYGSITNQPYHILTTKQDAQWSDGGFYIDSLAGSNREGGKFISPKGIDTAIQYKAVYTGTVLVEVNDLFFTTNDTYFGVFVNGQMIWPNTGDCYADNSKWLTGDKDVNFGSNGDNALCFGDAIEVAITAGDVIEFVCRVGANAAGDPYGYYNPDFTITYTERTAAAYASSYNADFSLTPYNTDGIKWNTIPTLPQNWDASTMGELTPDTLKAYLQDYFKLGHTNRGYGAWSVGVFDDVTGAYEAITRVNGFADKHVTWEYDSDGDEVADSIAQTGSNGAINETYDLNWGITESAYQTVIDTYLSGSGNTSPWAGNYGAAYIPKHGAVQPSNNSTIYTYCYTVPETGVATFSYDRVSAKNITNVAIYVNNVKVWPAGAAWYSAFTDNADADTAAINAALAEVSADVLAGDVVRFAVMKTGWLGAAEGGNGSLILPAVSVKNDDLSAVKAIVSYCDKNGNEVARYTCNIGDAMPNPGLLVTGYDYTGDGIADEIPATVTGDITFTAVSDIIGASRFDKNFPTIVDGMAAFTGNWKTVKGNWNVDYAVDTETKPFWTYSMDMDTYANPAFVGSDKGMWDAAGGGCYAANRKFAVRGTASQVGVGAMYTVPYSGVVDIFYTAMQAVREVNPTTGAGVISEYFAILLNGEVIWPATGTPWLYTGDTEYAAGTSHTDNIIEIAPVQGGAFPTNVTVSAGDEIVFVGNMGNDTTWMAYFDGAVTYTSLINDVAVEAGVSLGDNFGVDFYLTPDANATEYGIVAGENKIVADENGIASIGGVAAKELGDEVVVTPYQVINGKTVYSEEIAVTVAELLYKYVGGEDEAAANVAIAMLNYGAAAQTYFGYCVSDLVNADLTDNQKVVAPAGTYVTGSSTALDGATVDLQSVTLLLEDYICLKLVVDSKEEGLKMEIGADAEFTVSDLVEMEKTADETGYKVIGETEPLGWNTLLYFRVVDAEGNPVSRTIAYSVTAYCGNMAENETVNDVTNAILALYDAIVAYNTAE